METMTRGWTPLDMFTFTMMLTVGAGLAAALFIHGVWPKTEATPTALGMFISAMLFRTAAGIRESVAAGGHITRAAFEPESYALWALFCLVLWLTLYVLALRRANRGMVDASRTAKAEAERSRLHVDHLPGEEWDAVEREREHARP